MDENTRRAIARRGGERVPNEKRSFSRDRALAAAAGRKGGAARSRRRPEGEAEHHEQADALPPEQNHEQGAGTGNPPDHSH